MSQFDTVLKKLKQKDLLIFILLLLADIFLGTSQAALTFLEVENIVNKNLPHTKKLFGKFLIIIGKKSRLYRCCELISEKTL